jgi:tetratricopeptide (TPR) repeat protein
VAKSPEAANAPTNATERYLLNWAALGNLLDQGRSFSGHERNCAFLNTGGKAFANVSASTGLDLMDDGRAVAVCDWNFDGKLDFWVTNRTAPRVRLLMNESDPDASGNFVAIRLKGKTCNRDAIGARVEIYIGGESRPRIRTLHAGQGFLSQSSRWLHWGLGENSSIKNVIVRWPGSDPEPVSGVMAGRFFEIVQQTLKAKPWPAPTTTLPPAPEIEAPTETAHRTWIIGRVPLPRADYLDWTGKSIPFRPKQVTALNLWSATCLPCQKELRDWTDNAKALADAGVKVAAFCVDHLASEDAQIPERSRAFAKQLNVPFLTGLATAQLVSSMEVVQRTFLQLQKPLPVPATFLLDEKGRVAGIYKGPVSAQTLISDAQLLTKLIEEQREAALPYSGRWASLPFPPDPLRVATTFSAAGQTNRAIEYVRDLLDDPEEHLDGIAGSEAVRRVVRSSHALLGQLHLDNDDPAKAAEAYRPLLKLAREDATLHREIGESLLQHNIAPSALEHLLLALPSTPNDPKLLFNVGLAKMGNEQPAEAVEYFKKADKVQPEDLATQFQLGNALLALGDPLSAANYYEEALRIQPSWPYAAHQLAWLRATWPDPRVRNSEQAVDLAESVCQRDGGANPITLHTLTAALAESNRFGEALRINARAIEIAGEDARYRSFLATLEKARDLFRSKKPLRDRKRKLQR